MTVTIPLGSGIGTKAKNPGGLGAEPPGTRQPDEPETTRLASQPSPPAPLPLRGQGGFRNRLSAFRAVDLQTHLARQIG